MPFDYQKFISEQNKLSDEMKKCYDEMADEVNKRVANFAQYYQKKENQKILSRKQR